MFRLDRVAWSKKLKNLEELLIHCKNSYILFYSRERRGLEREEYLCIYFKNFKGTLISIWWKDKPSSTARSSFSITKYSGCRRARKFPSRRQNEKRRPRGRGGGGGGGLTRDCRGKFLDEIAGSPFRCNETAFHSTGKNIATPRCRDNWPTFSDRVGNWKRDCKKRILKKKKKKTFDVLDLIDATSFHILFTFRVITFPRLFIGI